MNGFDGDIRDMLGCASHVEVCGIAGIWGICGTDHLPEIGPWGLPFFWTAPPIHEGREKGTANASQPKRNAYFPFKLLIINDINQYFNIHLHLISFIIYNRWIFIVKYLFGNKTYIIFAMWDNNINKQGVLGAYISP